MRINNNIMAMNTYRQLSIANNYTAKSMEKLSSGYRINRAGDDAAGLAISEKMRGQIRGLKQASRNAQDGISLVQIAEGALNETQAILQRMRELAVQSATDTNTDVDRSEIQAEINQLAEEITRIAETTEFNTKKLLDGTFRGKFHIGANEGQNIELSINAMDAQALKVSGSGEGKATYVIKPGDITLTGTSNFDNLAIAEGENKLSVVKIDNILIGSDIANYGLANEKGEIVAISTDGGTYKLLTEATKESDLALATVSTATITFDDKVISGEVSFTATAASDSTITNITATATIDVEGLATGEYTVVDYTDQLDDYFTWTSDGSTTVAVDTILDFVLVDSNNKVVAVSEDGENFYALESLEKSKDGISDITDVLVLGAKPLFTSANVLDDGKTISIKADGGIDVSSQEAASKAITVINSAIERVSAERSKLGATQNRLEHTIKNLDTSAENLQAAESRIRDVDMAQEMMEYTKNNILQQAAQAMLAQANQVPQGVLQLLR